MIRIYNSLTGKVEEFKPIKEKELKMYVCGSTVYNGMHIGNTRPIIFFDVVARFFKYLGYKVTYVSNFTDIDDKIINKAKAEGVSEEEIANRYIKLILGTYKKLNILPHDANPRVTETMDDIVKFIQLLVDKKKAYIADGDVYFNVDCVEDYGTLSGQKLDDLIAGARVDENDKKHNPFDFNLWKETLDGVKWHTCFSDGRPGWHTECCVMIENIFHSMIDIHGGGSDLIFPHHENEIAQSEAAYNHRIANLWVHNARVNFGDEKMSKSLGNVIWAKDLKCNPLAYRLLVLSFPYRNIISYTEELQNQFSKEYEKIQNSYNKLFTYLDINDLFDDSIETEVSNELMNKFDQENDNDMNTPNGVSIIYETLKQINQALRTKEDNKLLISLYNALDTMLKVYGLNYKKDRMSESDKDIYKKWALAREEKDFAKADEYRKLLLEKGISL